MSEFMKNNKETHKNNSIKEIIEVDTSHGEFQELHKGDRIDYHVNFDENEVVFIESSVSYGNIVLGDLPCEVAWRVAFNTISNLKLTVADDFLDKNDVLLLVAEYEGEPMGKYLPEDYEASGKEWSPDEVYNALMTKMDCRYRTALLQTFEDELCRGAEVYVGVKPKDLDDFIEAEQFTLGESVAQVESSLSLYTTKAQAEKSGKFCGVRVKIKEAFAAVLRCQACMGFEVNPDDDKGGFHLDRYSLKVVYKKAHVRGMAD